MCKHKWIRLNDADVVCQKCAQVKTVSWRSVPYVPYVPYTNPYRPYVAPWGPTWWQYPDNISVSSSSTPYIIESSFTFQTDGSVTDNNFKP